MKYSELEGAQSIPLAKEAMLKGLQHSGIPASDIKTEVGYWMGRKWLTLVSWKSTMFDGYRNFPDNMKWQLVIGWSFVSFDPTTWSHAICLAYGKG